MSETPAAHEEAHTGPIKTPRQMLTVSVLGFVLPVIIIVGLVMYVTAAPKPASVGNSPAEVEQRIAKVGTVTLGVDPALRPQMSGEAVFKAQCATCHATGLAGAPKFGDAGAWTQRLNQPFTVLVEHSLKGKGAMAPQGGGNFTDFEISRAVAYMANASGGKFAEPAPPAAAASAPASGAVGAASMPAATASVPASAPASGEASAIPASAPAPVAAATPAAPTVGADAGKKLYEQACVACHAAGVAGAPKLGDKAAWQQRASQGVDALTAHVIAGKGAMPPRGASTASDAEIHAAVAYMVNSSK